MKQAGFTLLDVLIAVTITVVGLSAILAAYSGIIDRIGENKLYNEKVYIAQDIIEKLKPIDNVETTLDEDIIREYLSGYDITSTSGSLDNKEGLTCELNIKIKSNEDNESQKEKYKAILLFKWVNPVINNEKENEEITCKKLISCNMTVELLETVQLSKKKDSKLQMTTYYYLK